MNPDVRRDRPAIVVGHEARHGERVRDRLVVLDRVGTVEGDLDDPLAFLREVPPRLAEADRPDDQLDSDALLSLEWYAEQLVTLKAGLVTAWRVTSGRNMALLDFPRKKIYKFCSVPGGLFVPQRF